MMNEIDAMLQKKAGQTGSNNQKVAYMIKILNMATKDGRTIPVYGVNSLGQVVEKYGKRIGLKSEKNGYWFYNLQSPDRYPVSSQKVTFSEFGIGPGDTLGISDDRVVSAG